MFRASQLSFKHLIDKGGCNARGRVLTLSVAPGATSHLDINIFCIVWVQGGPLG